MADILNPTPPKPEVVDVSQGMPGVIVTPPGFGVHSIEPFVAAFNRRQPMPPRRVGTYMAADVPSLLDWMKDNCDDGSPVFAAGAESLAESWRSPELSLVGIGNYSAKDKPLWHDFQAMYEFPVTKQWREWTGKHGEWMKQGEFAEFVEVHLHEFSAPDPNLPGDPAVTTMIAALGGPSAVGSPSDMYTLSRGVKLYVNQSVEVSLDRATGEQALRFTEEHTGKGDRPVPIPKFFYIEVPIFFGEPPTLVGALLRYRNSGTGTVMWSYELFAPDIIVKEAFDAACHAVRDANRRLYLGSPDLPREA